MKRDRNTPPTPQSEMIGRNELLAMLGLPIKADSIQWIERQWEGEIKWHKRTAHKGYSPELAERIKSNLNS